MLCCSVCVVCMSVITTMPINWDFIENKQETLASTQRKHDFHNISPIFLLHVALNIMRLLCGRENG